MLWCGPGVQERSCANDSWVGVRSASGRARFSKDLVALMPWHHPAPLERLKGWQPQSCVTMTPEGAEIEIVLANAGPVEAYVLDQTPGLPPAGASSPPRVPAAYSARPGPSSRSSRRQQLDDAAGRVLKPSRRVTVLPDGDWPGGAADGG